MNQEIVFINSKLFPDRLKEIRKNRKLTQRELSRLMGVSQQMVSKWESEWNNITVDSLFRYSEVLHVRFILDATSLQFEGICTPIL